MNFMELSTLLQLAFPNLGLTWRCAVLKLDVTLQDTSHSLLQKRQKYHQRENMVLRCTTMLAIALHDARFYDRQAATVLLYPPHVFS